MKLEDLRKKCGMLQKDVAAKFDLSPRQYRRIEKQEVIPDILLAISIANLFGVDNPKDIWGGQSPVSSVG